MYAVGIWHLRMFSHDLDQEPSVVPRNCFLHSVHSRNLWRRGRERDMDSDKQWRIDNAKGLKGLQLLLFRRADLTRRPRRS
jgi:hypothetical protein